MEKKEKIGVYVCHCGTNIAGVVNVGEVSTWAAENLKDQGVVICTRLQVHVLQPGPGTDREGYQGTGPDPRGGGRLFPPPARKDLPQCLQRRGSESLPVRTGLHPRTGSPGCIPTRLPPPRKPRPSSPAASRAWSTTKPLEPLHVPDPPGHAGRRRRHRRHPGALEIADAGFPVYLVEREPSIGGHMAQFDKTFPTLDCSACILTPKMVDVGNHPTSPC